MMKHPSIYLLGAIILCGCANAPDDTNLDQYTYAVAAALPRAFHIDTLAPIHVEGGGFVDIEEPEWEIDRIVLDYSINILEISNIDAVAVTPPLAQELKPVEEKTSFWHTERALPIEKFQRAKELTGASHLILIEAYSGHEPVYASTYTLNGGFGLMQKRSLRGKHAFAYVLAAVSVYDLNDKSMVRRGNCAEYIEYPRGRDSAPRYWYEEDSPLPAKAREDLKKKLEKLWRVCTYESLRDIGLIKDGQANPWLAE